VSFELFSISPLPFYISLPFYSFFFSSLFSIFPLSISPPPFFFYSLLFQKTNVFFSDLAKFIAGDRIPCTIDRVQGIIETNRPDDKNKQYTDVVKQGDALITKLQKYGQAVRLRGSERG
jgi:hypothetical protein